MADQKISLTISGKDELTPAATTAASSIKKVGDHADEAKHKVKSFGEQMNDLRPKGETLAVGMQAVALAVGSVAAVFYKAAGASEALGGKMKEAGDAANSSLGALGDAIAKSGAFNAAMDGIIRGLGDFTDAIGKNQKAVDDLIRAGIDPLTIAFKGVTKIVGGLAMVGLLASETLGPIGNLLVGIQRQSMAVFEFIYKSWANLAAFMTNSDQPFPDFDPFAGGKQAYEGAKGLYGLASGDAHLEQRLNRIINTMEMTEAAADAARDAALGAGSAAGSGRSAPMRNSEVWSFDQEPTEQSVLRPEGGGKPKPKTGGGRGGLRSSGSAAAKYDWGQDIYRPFYEDWSRPEEDTREVGPQWPYQNDDMTGPGSEITEQMQWDRESELKPMSDEWRNVYSGLISSSQQLGDTFARLAFTSLSVSDGLQSIIPGVAGMLGSAAQTLVPGLGGQAIGAGIGILGSVIGSMFEGKSHRKEYTVQDPLPVKVVNKEDLQQVTIYNVTVAGSGLLQKAQTNRLVGQAMRAQDRTGGGAPATPR